MEAFNCFPLLKKPPNLLLFPPKPKIPSPFHRIRVSNYINNKFAANSISTDGTISKPRHEKAGEPRAPNDLNRRTTKARVSDKRKISDELKKETEEILEWSSICSQVAAFASTAGGRAQCRGASLVIGRDREESEKLLGQTKAAVLLPNPLNFSGVDDVSEIVRWAVDGEMLTVRQLCTVERSIRAVKGVFEQLTGIAGMDESFDRYHPLLDILQNCDFLTELANKIGFCIDCSLCVIPDRASKKLRSIRSDRRANSDRLDSLLKEVSVNVFQAGGIDSPLVTKRRSRMCVGIKASHKYLLPEGIVLSVSSSGATYFMEPKDAVELNNMEVRLSNSERAEELTILGFLSSEIAGAEAKIRHLMEKVVELDLACARGAHALWMNGVSPVFSEDNERVKSNREFLSVDIEGIHHPLLLQPSLRSLSSISVPEAGRLKMLNPRDRATDSENLIRRENPMPLNIKIMHTTNVVVISGPNTGGKTATMKTLGLASLMSKAGMYLPAKNRPKLPWFDQILADIGDRQSLEHNLSTFSGHISRLCKIMEVASERSLVLVDEIGSGTDPSEGVALSTSILQHLAGCVNLAMVTTHYADLSRLKAVDSRFENAAMEFSMETLQPTYRILWGTTGDSNALSIAKSIGFDQKVLYRAQEWVEKLEPDKQKERHGFLHQSLLEERNLLEAQAKEAASVLSEVKKLHHEIHSEAANLDGREAALKAKESLLVKQELQAVKSQLDTVIKNFEIKLQNANRDQFSSVLRESEAVIASIVEAHRPSSDILYEETENHSSYIPQSGDKVYVRGLGEKLAIVVEEAAEDGATMVQYGKIKVRVKRHDMKLVQSSTERATNSSSLHVKRQEQGKYYRKSAMEGSKDKEDSFGPAVRTSKNTVDLRGMRVEEASHHLHMAISGSRSGGVLFVVHGTGTGAVKERATDILKNHPRVVKFEEESPMNYGCTVAYIK